MSWDIEAQFTTFCLESSRAYSTGGDEKFAATVLLQSPDLTSWLLGIADHLVDPETHSEARTPRTAL